MSKPKTALDWRDVAKVGDRWASVEVVKFFPGWDINRETGTGESIWKVKFQCACGQQFMKRICDQVSKEEVLDCGCGIGHSEQAPKSEGSSSGDTGNSDTESKPTKSSFNDNSSTLMTSVDRDLLIAFSALADQRGEIKSGIMRKLLMAWLVNPDLLCYQPANYRRGSVRVQFGFSVPGSLAAEFRSKTQALNKSRIIQDLMEMWIKDPSVLEAAD